MERGESYKIISLQLHITGKCNLRCKHCYIDEHQFEMTFFDFKKVIKQFDVLIKELKTRNPKSRVIPQLRITGGEPFLHRDIDKIIKFASRKKYLLVIMSNGTLVKNKHLRRLKRNINFQNFQVSLDGCGDHHDEIRGKGNFDIVINALEMLHKYSIPTRVSFTANSENFKDFSSVAEICRKHHVGSLWSDRYIPFSGNALVKPLTIEDFSHYIRSLKEEKENPLNGKSKLRVENHRPLQFLGLGEQPHSCQAAETLITVDEKGDIMPCRRLPIICGNIHSTTLSDVYFNNRVFLDLREHRLSGKCLKCIFKGECLGGSRCMSYALTGKYDVPDPFCTI